jgi:16S rRNA (cytosine967-C5)-methyltransferase
MTPAARIAAAIELLDLWLAGEPAERALTNWARANRFAGSGDRAAIRDHVFDAIRCRRSFAALGGAETGRGLMIGALRDRGRDPALVFTGEAHAPPPLSGAEAAAPPAPADPLVRLDCPDWLAPALRASLGAEFEPVMEIMRSRAPVFLRFNAARTTREAAVRALAAEGVTAVPHPLSPTALEVTAHARRVKTARAFADGLVELQDAASQAVVDAFLPVPEGARVLDFCAGGGGKALAFAAAGARVSAHDADARRMSDLPERARRAGAEIAILGPGALQAGATFDLVLVDAPCSGSGAWRRQPEAKWRLDAARLAELGALQAAILREAARHVRPGGWLGYATCSLLASENGDVVRGFLADHRRFGLAGERRLTPLDGGDGFYVARIKDVSLKILSSCGCVSSALSSG